MKRFKSDLVVYGLSKEKESLAIPGCIFYATDTNEAYLSDGLDFTLIGGGGGGASTGLEAVDEGNGIGHRLIGKEPANYGGMGLGAIDLSHSDSISAVLGATGDYSNIAGGQDNRASGDHSNIGGGQDNLAEGEFSSIPGGAGNETQGIASNVGGGINNISEGNFSGVGGGVGNNAPSFGEWVAGLYSTIYTAVSTSAFALTDKIFNIGNGADGANRSDAFTVLKNGLATLPSVTNALIDASGTGKEIATTEWVNGKLPTGNIAYTDVINPFTATQNFTVPVNIIDGLITVFQFIVNNVVTGKLIATEDGVGIQVYDSNNLASIKTNYFFHRDSNSFINDNNARLGTAQDKWLEGHFSLFVNAAGFKSAENDPTKVFATDGSVVDLPSTKTVKVSLTAAQLKNLGTTPIDAIPAPGVGTVINIKSVFAKLTYGTVPFDDNPLIVDIDGSSNSWKVHRLLSDTVTGIRRAPYPDFAALGDDYLENTKVVITGTDSVAAGDSTIDVYITYEIITL